MADASAIRDLHAFVLELGRALALAGTAVSETQERLTAVAAASGVPDARVVVLPTALIIAFGRPGSATIESIPQFSGALRLDQISALYDLIGAAERGEVEPTDGLARLRRIRDMAPRHGLLVTLMSYTAMTIGLCLILQPTPGVVANRDRPRRTRGRRWFLSPEPATCTPCWCRSSRRWPFRRSASPRTRSLSS